MLKFLILVTFLVSSACASPSVSREIANDSNQASESVHPVNIDLSSSLSGRSMPFLTHRGPKDFDNALALNIPYEPIKAMRPQIEKVIERPLKFLKSWNPLGEAHVTVITPPEFFMVLGKPNMLTMDDIDSIARANKIQNADLIVLGIGSGKKEINGVSEETFFVIVDSLKLRHIRNEIWKLYVKRGGDPKSWDPTWFFPHITIGYTEQDIHEPDVIKNLRSSSDPRFALVNK